MTQIGLPSIFRGALLVLPFHMDCKIRGGLFFELQDGRFQFLDSYETPPLIIGADYVLADHELTNFLQTRNIEEVTFRPAVLWNRKLNEELHTHARVHVGRKFEADQIASLNLEGDQMLLMDGLSLFVSPSLKMALEASRFDYLQFTEGLSDFTF